MVTFGRLRSLKHEQASCRKFPGWAASGAVGLILFLARLMPSLAIAQSEAPVALVPENFSWRSPPDNPALASAWVLGNGEKSGPDILRVHLIAGGRIRPHTHPDERNSTVLKGVLYVGFGRIFRRIEACRDSQRGGVRHPRYMCHTILRPRIET